MTSRVGALCVVGMLFMAATYANTQNEQASSATQASQAGTKRVSSGEKTLTGCVAREDGEFVLKTDEGTYEFNTSRDLALYVGKKVRISGRWNATGVTTIAPVKSTAGTNEPAKTNEEIAPAKSFDGDLHLHITGEVIGDCPQAR